MKRYLFYTILAVLLLLARGLNAQNQEEKRGFYIIGREITFRNDSAQFNITIQINNLNIYSDQALALEFAIENDNRKQALPTVTYEGSRFSRVDNRNYLLSYEYVAKPYHTFTSAEKNTSYTLEYKVGVPYASWMNHAALVLRQTLKDCCSEHQLHEKTLVPDINLKKYADADVKNKRQKDSLEVAITKEKNDYFNLINSMVYFLEPDEVKNNAVVSTPTKAPQSLELVTTVSYPRGGYTVSHQHSNNDKALFRIDSLLRRIESSSSTQLIKIELTGYTSIESSYQYNIELAQKRVSELKNYIGRNYRIATSLIAVRAIGEDWAGLTMLINQKQVPYKKQVLSIIKNIGIFNGREKALMDLADGDVYKAIQRDLFPALRRVEVKIVYKTTAASSGKSYQPATNPGYNDIVANNNAAAVAIAIGDTKKARTYLERIKNDSRSYINWGTLYYIEGNTAKAEEFFRKAANNNDTKDKAQANIRLLTEYTKK